MAFRFRRSKKVGPFRLTATKSGLSLSAGVPGARMSVNTRGQTRRTTGIPGSGIYQTTVTSNGHPKAGSQVAPNQPRQIATTVETQVCSATAGRRDLLFNDPAVVRLKVVNVKPSLIAEGASLAGMKPNADGWTRAIRDALLTPGAGDDYNVILMVQPADNPPLFNGRLDAHPKGMMFGRLGKAGASKWLSAFAGQTIGVVLYIDATPGAEQVEARFLKDELDGDAQDVST